MKYVGSKDRLSKELAPIIQSYIDENTKYYIEPFVGGANMIDKIQHDNKIGYDIHTELIELLKYIQDPKNKLPERITEEEYTLVKNNKSNYDKWYVGLVGFCSTFGAKYFGGYARSFKADKITPRDMSNEAIRNIEKQREKLKDIKFYNKSFLDIPTDNIRNSVIYCDIPYKGTLKYSTTQFPYEEFYQWCKSLDKGNIVLISEYNMPEDFVCIWEKEHKVGIDKKEHSKRTERLYTIK